MQVELHISSQSVIARRAAIGLSISSIDKFYPTRMCGCFNL